MSDILKQIQALQEQFSNLLSEELEKEGPKGEIKDLSRPPRKDYFDKKIEAAKTNFRTADKVARNNWKKFQASDDIDSSGYSDSYANFRTADDKREKALDNYEFTKKEMNAARKGLAIEPKSTMEHIRRTRARRENATKMNDNNSYNEIVSQIMDLKEAFSNLFEVEGLGNPAVDVPPSQNKIKKDVKTKDGKAELVSVEDELFPYDGNKREQYRQKILDTINGMIQGTSTLEDLLQIVRQKKAPLKEAIEVLEGVINEVSDEWKEKAQQKAYSNLRNAQIDKDNKETAFNSGDMGVDREQVKGAIRNVQKHAARAAKLDNAIMKHDGAKMEGRIKPASESLKEAVEILEGMINELYPDTVKSALHAHNKKTIELEDKVNKRIGEIFKKHGIKGNTYSAATAEDRQKAAETEKEIKEDPEIKDLHNQQEKRAKKNELYRNAIRKARKSPVEEALEIMEAIINEVSIGKWKEAAASSLSKRKEEAEAAKAAAEKGREEYDKVSREHPEDEPALYRLAQSKDEEAAKAEDKADHAYAVTRLKTHGKVNANKVIKAAKKVQDKREDEFGRNPEKRTFLRSGKANQLAAADPVKSRADEALEEALEIMEAIINELDYKFVSKQKASADKTLANKVKAAEDEEEGKNKEAALDDVAKYKHKMNTTMDHVERKRMNEIKAEEAKKNK